MPGAVEALLEGCGPDDDGPFDHHPGGGGIGRPRESVGGLTIRRNAAAVFGADTLRRSSSMRDLSAAERNGSKNSPPERSSPAS